MTLKEIRDHNRSMLPRMEAKDNALIHMAEAMASIGSPMYKVEFLGRVLALGELTGWGEAFVLNKALNAVTMLAARTMGLQGGCYPDPEHIDWYIKAVKTLGRHGAETDWLEALVERYNLDKKSFMGFDYAKAFKDYENTPLFQTIVRARERYRTGQPEAPRERVRERVVVKARERTRG